MLLALLSFLLCCFVSVTGVLKSDTKTPASSNVLMEKYLWKNTTMSATRRADEATTSAYKFPTATWSAAAYEERRKLFRPETSKLYLFKPSPFLKPPFTEGNVGASISGIEDGVDVMGRRSGKPTKISSDRRIAVGHREERRDQEAMEDSSHSSRQLDHFLEHSLGKYLKSSNLSEIFGHISIETFSEALKKVLEEKRLKTPPYDQNKELRRKFRDEVLFPKKSEHAKHNGGLRESQYRKRLRKTWEIINENPVQRKVATAEDRIAEFVSARNTPEAIQSDFDDVYAYPSLTEMPSSEIPTSTAAWIERDPDFDGFDATPSPTTETTPFSPQMAKQMWEDGMSSRESVRGAYATSEVSITSPALDMMTETYRGRSHPLEFRTDAPIGRITSEEIAQSSMEQTNAHDFEATDYASTEKSASEQLLEAQKASINERQFFNDADVTTEVKPMVTDSDMPTQMYRGRTKYRDTVKNSLDNSLPEDDGELKLTVAETVYYRPRVSPVNTFTYKEESSGAIPGQPGKDYPIYSSPPRGTGFRCPRLSESEHTMKADRSTRCQVFYICKGKSPPSPGLCPNGTVFNEDVLVCDWWYNVDC